MANYCVYSGGNGTSGVVAGSVPTSGEWATAYQSISACLAAITEADGDIIFVAHDHNHNAGVAITISPAAGISILSIDRLNTTTATLLAGAQEETGGNSTATISQTVGNCYIYGLTLKAGTGTSQSSSSVSVFSSAGSIGTLCVDKCSFIIASTSSTPSFSLGSNGTTSGVRTITMLNSTIKFGSSGQKIFIYQASVVEMTGCSIDGAGSLPNALFSFGGTSNGSFNLLAKACDFSNSIALLTISSSKISSAVFIACKVPSTLYSGTHAGLGGLRAELTGCGTATDDHNYQYTYLDGSGQIDHNTSIYLTTGGASFTDTGGTAVPVSLLTVSSANATKPFPLKTPWFNVAVASTGSKTFSVKIAYDNATALKDVDCWLELEYMADTANPMTTNVITAPVVSGTNSLDALAAGSNLTDTSAGWTGTSGWTNKKTATLSKTVTVNQIGFARARVCLAKASTTIYVDPQVTVA